MQIFSTQAIPILAQATRLYWRIFIRLVIQLRKILDHRFDYESSCVFLDRHSSSLPSFHLDYK